MNEPLDIAFVVSADTTSGTYFRYHNLAIALSKLGHRLTVYSQHRYKRGQRTEETRDGVRYILAPSMPGDRFFGFAVNPGNVLGRLLLGSPGIMGHEVYQLFQPHLNAAFVWSIVRAWRRRRAKPAIFAWDWDDLWGGHGLAQVGPSYDRMEVWLINRLEKTLPERADLVTTCSHYLRDLAVERGARKTSVVHNCIWEEPARPDRAALRREFGLREDACYLGFIGWTASELEWCFEALRRLDPRVRLVCAGCDLAAMLGGFPDVADRVDPLGVLSPARAKRLMQALDIGLLPLMRNDFNASRFPMKFLDYLSAGLTVVCGEVGEVGLLGRELPGVVLTPPEREPWVAACVETADAFLRGTPPPPPDLPALHHRFLWNVSAASLERSYREALAGVS